MATTTITIITTCETLINGAIQFGAKELSRLIIENICSNWVKSLTNF